MTDQMIEATIVFTGLTVDQVRGVLRSMTAQVDALGGEANADFSLLCAQCERAIIPPETAKTNDAGDPICGSCELTNFIEEQNEALDEELPHTWENDDPDAWEEEDDDEP